MFFGILFCFLNIFRTPTPFKIAMAELGKKSGLKYEPSSPGLLVEDITEMIKREEKGDSNVQLNDSMLSSTADTESIQVIIFLIIFIVRARDTVGSCLTIPWSSVRETDI